MTDLLLSGVLAETVRSVVSSVTTITLTASSATFLNLTGSTAQTIKLPDATTCAKGQRFVVGNKSSATVTVQYQDASAFTTIASAADLEIRLLDNTTANGVWMTLFSPSSGSTLNAAYLAGNTISTVLGTGPVIIGGTESLDITATKGMNLTGASGFNAFDIVMSGAASALNINHSGSSTAVIINKTTVDGTALALTQSTGVSNTVEITNNGTGRALTGVSSTANVARFVNTSATNATLRLENTNTSGSLLYLGGATSGNITIGVPNTISVSYGVVLPSAQGASGQTLLNNGSGTLTWGTPNSIGSTLYLWENYT